MKDVFRETIKQLNNNESIVIATVIRTKGSTPQKPGAKLLVKQDGSGVGTLGGGCVEGDIWFAAKQLMNKKGSVEYREYELNEDLAAEDGLVCGGTMYFLIDPVYDPEVYLPYANEINQAYEGNGAVAVATVTKSNTSNNSKIGNKLIVRQDNTTDGTLGNNILDEDAFNRSKSLMIYGKNEYVVSDSGT